LYDEPHQSQDAVIISTSSSRRILLNTVEFVEVRKKYSPHDVSHDYQEVRRAQVAESHSLATLNRI
jgi:hypothetical protein